jgi:hypothetical protein
MDGQLLKTIDERSATVASSQDSARDEELVACAKGGDDPAFEAIVKRHRQRIFALATRQMTLLSEMGDLLQCCATTDEAYSVIAQSAKKLFPTPTSGMLYAFKSSRNALESVAIWANRARRRQSLRPTCAGLGVDIRTGAIILARGFHVRT